MLEAYLDDTIPPIRPSQTVTEANGAGFTARSPCHICAAASLPPRPASARRSNGERKAVAASARIWTGTRRAGRISDQRMRPAAAVLPAQAHYLQISMRPASFDKIHVSCDNKNAVAGERTPETANVRTHT